MNRQPTHPAMTQPLSMPRRHDLDALRAFAMLLGIALHAAMVYIGPTVRWPVQDVEHSRFFGLFVSAVHGFRMPLFFLVSGFFTAMLWRKRGLRALLWQRFRRIFLPLLIGLFTIGPAMEWSVDYLTREEASGPAAEVADVDAHRDIWAATRKGDVDAVQRHLDAGAELDAQDPDLHSTALTTAAFMGETEVVRLLIAAGADVNARNGDKGTALHAAAFFGHPDIVKLLLDHGADVNIRNVHDETPLDTTRHDWPVVRQIAGIVRCTPDEEQVNEGRPIIVGLIEASPAMQAVSPWTRVVQDVKQALQTPILHHLWFLWFLCLLVGVFAVYARISDWCGWRGLPNWLCLPPVCLLWLIPLTMLPQTFMRGLGPDTSLSLLPNPAVLGYYAVFFGYGAFYFDAHDKSMRLARGWPIWLLVGVLVLFPLASELTYPGLIPRGGLLHSLFVAPIENSGGEPQINTLLQATYAWAMTIGLMGLFHWALRRENRLVRYLSDASYWLYLTHLPTLFYIQYWLRDWRMPALIKFLTSCVLVTGLLLVIYQLVVRYTWIGRLLNGPRKRPEKSDPAVELQPAEA